MNNNQIVAFKRNPIDPLSPIAVRADERAKERRARVRDAYGNSWAKDRLLHRLIGLGRAESPLSAILRDNAPGILEALRGAQKAPNKDSYAASFRMFDEAASEVMHRIETSGPQTRGDAGLYTLLAPIYAMQKTIEQLLISPQLINLLPKMTLGTPLEQGMYLEYTPGIAASEATWEYGTGGSSVAAGKHEVKLINLHPFRTAVEVSGREREVHEAMRGQMGAPAWDLFQKRMEEAMFEANMRMSHLVSFGLPGSSNIYGLLSDTAQSGITVDTANFDSGTGLTDRNTIVGQIKNTANQVAFDPRLLPDTVIFDAESWWNLTGRGVSNTGDSDANVIGQVFQFRPEINEITYALELGPRADLIAALTPKVGATEATRLGGGYNDGGTHKRCMVILRNDPEVLAAMEGLPISYEPLDEQDGAVRGMIRGSCGGLRAFRKTAIRIVKIS